MAQALEIIRGDDEAIIVTVKTAAGASLIKSGARFFLTVKRAIHDSDTNAIFKKDYPVTADADSFTMDLSNTETKLKTGGYYADIQFKDDAGKLKTIYRGEFLVKYDITIRTA